MARSEFFMCANDRFFRRSTDGRWSELTALSSRSRVRGMCFSRAGTLAIARERGNVQIWTPDGWKTALSATRSDDLTGIGQAADGTFYVATAHTIFTSAENQPLLSPTPPQQQSGIQGLSVHQKTGNIAICVGRQVYALTPGGTWTNLNITSTGLEPNVLQSISYGPNGELYVFNSSINRWHKRNTDGVWSLDFSRPDRIGGRDLSNATIFGASFDQGRGLENLNIGGDSADELKIGSEAVSAAYLGDTQIWG